MIVYRTRSLSLTMTTTATVMMMMMMMMMTTTTTNDYDKWWRQMMLTNDKWWYSLRWGGAGKGANNVHQRCSWFLVVSIIISAANGWGINWMGSHKVAVLLQTEREKCANIHLSQVTYLSVQGTQTIWTFILSWFITNTEKEYIELNWLYTNDAGSLKRWPSKRRLLNPAHTIITSHMYFMQTATFELWMFGMFFFCVRVRIQCHHARGQIEKKRSGWVNYKDI